MHKLEATRYTTRRDIRCFVFSGAAPLRASVKPTRVSASIGHSLRLNCSTEGYPVREVSWTKDSRPLYTSDRIKIIYNEVLVVNGVKRQDRGMYQCFVRNRFETVQAASEVIINGENTRRFI